MFNILNISENYFKYQNVLISILADYYGQEYFDLIKSRIDPIYIDFSSIPTEDYRYVLAHSKKVSLLINFIIKDRYELYKRLENKSRKIHFDLLAEYILKVIPIAEKLKNSDDWNSFLHLFSDDNFNKSLIDAFNSYSISLLNDDNTALWIKESILKDQEAIKEFCKKYEITTVFLEPTIADEIIQYREKLWHTYRLYLVKNSLFGKNMRDAINRKFNIYLNYDIVSDIYFKENAYAGCIKYMIDDEVSYYNYIRLPIVHLINIGVKGLDVNLIHELIHKIETDKFNVGIANLSDKCNDIVNEIRTQRLAIRITKILHDQGIFIFDDPSDYRIEGESAYEILFPLTSNFFDKYEDIFSKCAINNDGSRLNELFGESWPLYSKYLDDIYQKNMYLITNFGKVPNVQMNDYAASLLADMELTYSREENRHV